MKDIVIRIREDVCKAHNRDPEATTLIEAARTFGTVETLENALASEKAKWQANLNNLIAQHEAEVKELNVRIAAIEENAVTPAELELLRVIRKKSAAEAEEFTKAIAARDEQFQALMLENDARKAQIKTLFGL